MNRTRATLLGLLLLMGCYSDREIPDEVLPMNRMGEVLYQVTLADAYLENYVFRDSALNRDSAIRSEMDKVLLVNQVSSEVFRDSYAFYKRKPILFREIIDTVHARSLRSQERLYNRPRKVRKGKIMIDTTAKN